jgi:hypothetical protein
VRLRRLWLWRGKAQGHAKGSALACAVLGSSGNGAAVRVFGAPSAVPVVACTVNPNERTCGFGPFIVEGAPRRLNSRPPHARTHAHAHTHSHARACTLAHTPKTMHAREAQHKG